MVGIFTTDEMQRYSKKFLCGLYRMSHGNMNNTARSIDVFFRTVSAEAYERPSLGFQATNAIIQQLINEGFIEQDTPDDVRLTLRGLQKCKNDC